MISPIEKSNRIDKDYVSCDIENRETGEVLGIDTYDGTCHYEHTNWEQWLDFIVKRAKKDRRFRVIYAHNGGGWDWLSLIEWIAKHTSHPFTTVQNNNSVIVVILPICKGVTLKLVDSLHLLKGSLDSVAKKLLGRGKVELDHLPEWYYDNDRETYDRYKRLDTELLYDCIRVFSDLVYEKIAPISKLGVTLPSTAMRVFRTAYLHHPISIPEDEKVRALLREAYVGGRVECFKPGYYKKVNVYDFNSLYPSVMVDTRVPTTGKVQWTNTPRMERAGVFRVHFTQRNRDKPPILLHKGRGVYSGTGVYFTNELQRLCNDANGTIEVIEGFHFMSDEVLFRDYVQTIYGLRMTDKNGPLGEVCKYLLNTLYGKWATKPERSHSQRMDYETMCEFRDNGSKVEILSEEYGIYRITEEYAIPYEHVGIAGVITSEARSRLWEAMDKDTIYCDTDSIHTIHSLPNDPNNLGSLKREFTGEGVYCGKKLYGLRNPEKEKVRAKGVKVGGKLGCKLDFDTLRTLLSGEKVECNFRSAVTANAVLRGNKSCRMEKRKRTIRMTA